MSSSFTHALFSHSFISTPVSRDRIASGAMTCTVSGCGDEADGEHLYDRLLCPIDAAERVRRRDRGGAPSWQRARLEADVRRQSEAALGASGYETARSAGGALRPEDAPRLAEAELSPVGRVLVGSRMAVQKVTDGSRRPA